MGVYRGPPAGALLAEPLDGLVALYHRPSGVTHVVASPVPELLEALADGPATADELLARLGAAYSIPDADRAALTARLDELVAAGLVETT